LTATLLRRVGLFASCIAGFALVNLNLPFGPTCSPGIFDVLGDLLIKGLRFTDRPCEGNTAAEELWENPVGDSHPEVARFVDDLFSLIAQHGNRSTDHLLRLRGQLTDCLGDHALNLKKQGVEGTTEPYKHAFGAVLDCCGRKLKSCWSKLVKVSNLLLPFINGEVPTLTGETVEQVRGVAGHVTACAPGMARLLLPRLDAWLSAAARMR
jgi:hypothetical protein